MRRLFVRTIPHLVLIVAFSLSSYPSSAAAPRDRTRPGSRPSAASSPRPSATNPAAGIPANPATPRTARSNQRPTDAPNVTKPTAEARAEFQELISADWIWSPAHEKDAVPAGACYFRKTIAIGAPVEFAQVHAACDNQYELYVNGRLAGSGGDWRKMDVHDVAALLRPGMNVIAFKATNIDAGAAGLVARVIIKERGGTYENSSTDGSWRTSVKEFVNWAQPEFRDREWLAAKVYGPLGGVLPWGDEVVIGSEGSRFKIDPEFAVERLVTDEQAGSLIAMTFNARGGILASQEGGPLLLISDADQDGKFEKVQTFSDQLKNVQGILSLGTHVLAVGDGPDGGALYRLVDRNEDGVAEVVTSLIRFRGQVGEHGPHAVQLGPEGLVYVLIGNFARVDAPIDPRSPYSIAYEGDMVLPRYEDPQGHAVGVPTPGGTIIRTDTNGSFVEVVAGGLRNPYDFAFNADGELVTYDADMEWDVGTPWYRPTRINHVPPGAEFGWRSGWAKWPEYYLDSLPATLDVGPGSPTGVAAYDHVMFPQRLQGAMIVGDWATGKIHAVQLEPHGASYSARLTTLLKGRPLNVTDLDVGPDGALYFSTGGRGTDGGIYRLRWTGKVPAGATNLGRGIEQAIRQPQFHADWARQRIAQVKRELGDRWEPELVRILSDRRATSAERLRALDLMTFFGPAPPLELIVSLARDREPAMRAKVARLMGAQQIPMFAEPLTELLDDRDARVRRIACEAIAHRKTESPVDTLVGLLADPDRFVAFAARRALEGMPTDRWQDAVINANDPRTFLQGAAGLLAVDPSHDTAQRVLARCELMLREGAGVRERQRGHLTISEYHDVLRVVQLALVRGEIPPADVQSLTQQLVRDYPTSDPLANRELVKLFAYLQPPEAARAMAKQLESNIEEVEKLQIAGYAARLKSGWQTAEKLAMLRYLEGVRGIEGGHSVNAYIEFFARDFFTNLTMVERRQVIAAGERFPTSALSILAKLPTNPEPDVLAEIRALDQRLEGLDGEPISRLRVGTTAVLGASGEPASQAYLREVYGTNPQRRNPVAMSLAQHPDGENWDVLVDSLRAVEGVAAPEVLSALARVRRRPKDADDYRNVILLGLRLSTNGGDLAVRLLEFWSGESLTGPRAPLDEQFAAWQAWYARTFPDALPAQLPQEATPNKWSYDELASFLDSPAGRAGSSGHGAQVFHEAQCIKCHRFHGRGESIGPDLTTVSQRFQRKEVLEAIVYPSHVVSDQYASQMVIAGGRTYTGIAARSADGNIVVLQSNGEKVRLAADDVEEIEPSKLSSMPDGLLNPLSLEEVADLFAFLMASPGETANRGAATQR
jgi:putative heme-binding domain-containing protein